MKKILAMVLTLCMLIAVIPLGTVTASALKYSYYTYTVADGKGTNGTCIRWLFTSIDCPNCGEHVNANTCHTCK